jgi:hypothetical protein
MPVVCIVQLWLHTPSWASEGNQLSLPTACLISGVGYLASHEVNGLIIEQHYSATHLNYDDYIRFDAEYV